MYSSLKHQSQVLWSLNRWLNRQSRSLPWGQAGFPALAAAGVNARPIVKETAQGQLLPDGLPLILLGLQQKNIKIQFIFTTFFHDEQTDSQKIYGGGQRSGWVLWGWNVPCCCCYSIYKCMNAMQIHSHIVLYYNNNVNNNNMIIYYYIIMFYYI